MPVPLDSVHVYYLTGLGERLSTEATRKKDARGFIENKDAAIEGGKVAGRARIDAEKSFGMNIISPDNYLDLKKQEGIKRLEKKEEK